MEVTTTVFAQTLGIPILGKTPEMTLIHGNSQVMVAILMIHGDSLILLGIYNLSLWKHYVYCIFRLNNIKTNDYMDYMSYCSIVFVQSAYCANIIPDFNQRTPVLASKHLHNIHSNLMCMVYGRIKTTAGKYHFKSHFCNV